LRLDCFCAKANEAASLSASISRCPSSRSPFGGLPLSYSCWPPGLGSYQEMIAREGRGELVTFARDARFESQVAELVAKFDFLAIEADRERWLDELWRRWRATDRDGLPPAPVGALLTAELLPISEAVEELRAGAILVPVGFLLGGVGNSEGDPSLAIFLTVVGAFLVLVAVCTVAWSLLRRKHQ